MSKSTGRPITFKKFQDLRNKAKGFQADPKIMAGIVAAPADTQMFFTHLDCGFVFDKDSLLSVISKIIAEPDTGIIMMLGASDDPAEPARLNKPTLSLFPCKIDKVKDEYSIIHPDPAHPDDTPGSEHPGIVDLSKPGAKISNGVIEFMII